MIPVHAEIVSGRREVVLLAAGTTDDLRRLAQILRTFTPHFRPTEPRGGLVAPLSWTLVVQASGQLAAARDFVWLPGPRLTAWIAQELARRTAPAELAYRAPEGRTPYPWQVTGAQLIASTGSAIISDEAGTGKTITTALALAELRERGEDGPALVVCPTSVVDPWVDALADWGRFSAVAWRGTPAKRRELAGTADAYVVTYETARIDAGTSEHPGPLARLGAHAVVIDEHHLLKNPQAQRTAAVRRLASKAPHVIALSGTPVTHHAGDLWPVLAAMDPGAYPSRERWVHRYCRTVQGDYREEILGLDPAYEPEFRTTLLGQMRRVAKSDVLAQLPPKVYSVRTVDLPPAWRRVYDAMESQMLAELPDGQELSVMSVLAQLTRLSQLASAAAGIATTTEIVEGPAGPQEQTSVRVTLKAPSWKVDALLEVLAERPGQQVVTFAPSKQLIRLAGAAAAAAGLRVGYLTGDVTGRDRTATIATFQAGGLDLMCATTGAGGVGVTLTAARTVVFLQRPWSIVEATQSEDRCHRLGSERHDSIDIVDIVARGTIDARVRSVLRERAGALSELVQDPRVVATLLGGRRAADSPAATPLPVPLPERTPSCPEPSSATPVRPPSQRPSSPCPV